MFNLNEYSPKFFDAMKNYSVSQFAKDFVSGIIVAIIALPLSIALALASGVGPEQGIYTAIFAGFVISLLGGSSVQIAGPTAAFATIVAGIASQKGMAGLSLATIMAGLILILMGFLRFGNLIRFIPYTITAGFTLGIAITIVIGQLKDFFGLTFTRSPSETIEKLKECIDCIGTFNSQSFLVGLISLAILIIGGKFLKKMPPSLIAVIAGILIVKFGKLNVKTIGDLYTISSGLPKPALPAFSLSLVLDLLPNAFTIAVLAGIESLLSCVVADGMAGSRHKPNAELIAQGAGNIASALFGGIPATGAIARTAANIKNGGRSPVAGMVHSIVLLLILLILMPYASLIPMPTIASILFIVAYNMSGYRSCVALLKASPKSDISVFLISLFLTVAFDLVVAIEFGIVLASLLFLKRMADVTEVKSWNNIDEHNDPDATHLKDVPKETLVYEITGPMFFAASDKLMTLNPTAGIKSVIVRMRSVPAMDITALRALKNMKNAYAAKGITLILSHVQSQPLHVMEKSGFAQELGREHFCKNIDEAIEHAKIVNAKGKTR